MSDFDLSGLDEMPAKDVWADARSRTPRPLPADRGTPSRAVAMIAALTLTAGATVLVSRAFLGEGSGGRLGGPEPVPGPSQGPIMRTPEPQLSTPSEAQRTTLALGETASRTWKLFAYRSEEGPGVGLEMDGVTAYLDDLDVGARCDFHVGQVLFSRDKDGGQIGFAYGVVRGEAHRVILIHDERLSTRALQVPPHVHPDLGAFVAPFPLPAPWEEWPLQEVDGETGHPPRYPPIDLEDEAGHHIRSVRCETG